MKFLVTGGIERKENPNYSEGRGFEEARLSILDFKNKKINKLISLSESDDSFEKSNYPKTNPSILFTAATHDGDTLWLCTETEVFDYAYPSMKLRRKVSYPCFQNIHHVAPYKDKYIAVVSTGLDMVVLLDRQKLEIGRLINVEGKTPWHRFDSKIDYRLVHSTKPHDAHPNYFFILDGEMWATRLKQQDAINLNDFKKSIHIGGAGVHDGHVMGECIYFTCVYGEIIVVDRKTLQVRERIDLKMLEGVDRPLGWCRGIAFDKEFAYVAFGRLRPTKFRENISWARDFLAGRVSITKTRIVCYNLKTREKVDEYIMPKNELSAIYSIIPENK